MRRGGFLPRLCCLDGRTNKRINVIETRQMVIMHATFSEYVRSFGLWMSKSDFRRITVKRQFSTNGIFSTQEQKSFEERRRSTVALHVLLCLGGWRWCECRCGFILFSMENRYDWEKAAAENWSDNKTSSSFDVRCSSYPNELRVRHMTDLLSLSTIEEVN